MVARALLRAPPLRPQPPADSAAMSAIAATATATTAASTTAAATTATRRHRPTASATAAATTTAPRLALTGLVDGERAPVERLAVQLGDGSLRVFVAGKLDECEPARLARHAIGHDADADDFAPTGGACLTKSRLRLCGTRDFRRKREFPFCRSRMLCQMIHCEFSRERSTTVHGVNGRPNRTSRAHQRYTLAGPSRHLHLFSIAVEPGMPLRRWADSLTFTLTSLETPGSCMVTP